MRNLHANYIDTYHIVDHISQFLPRLCLGSDEEYSVLFPSMTLSYKVCTFSNLVGPFATSGPEGFPNNGLALPRGSPLLELSRGLLKRGSACTQSTNGGAH